MTRPKHFKNLDSIELQEVLYSQYFAGRGIDENPDTLPYKVKFDKGIPHEAIMWCVNNCQENWGWLFVDLDPRKTIPHCEESYLLFKSEEDAIHFKLQHKF